MYCMLGILYHLIYIDLEWFNIFFLFGTVEKCEQYNSDFDFFWLFLYCYMNTTGTMILLITSFQYAQIL